MAGTLYLCATPIGNLEDITARVLRTLREADLIAAEDTRHTRALLTHFDIHTPMTSYHEHNQASKTEPLIDRLLAGTNIALVTDAGTPAISDPGQVLARRCVEEGIRVESLPGACAVITALTMSGADARRFVFEGFLPQDKKERETVLRSLCGETRTAVLYEAPHRLVRTLKLLYEALGDRKVTLCRELTKIHEEAVRITLSSAEAYFTDREPRGEYALGLEGADPAQAAAAQAEAGTEGQDWRTLDLAEHVALYEAQGMDRKAAMKKAAADRGLSKRDIYNALLDPGRALGK